eukprot:357707-Chlamydomonas_euryale.AAC.2
MPSSPTPCPHHVSCSLRPRSASTPRSGCNAGRMPRNVFWRKSFPRELRSFPRELRSGGSLSLVSCVRPV